MTEVMYSAANIHQIAKFVNNSDSKEVQPKRSDQPMNESTRQPQSFSDQGKRSDISAQQSKQWTSDQLRMNLSPQTHSLQCVMFPSRNAEDNISEELENIIGADDIQQLRHILDTVTHCKKLELASPLTNSLCALSSPMGGLESFWCLSNSLGEVEMQSGLTTMGCTSCDSSDVTVRFGNNKERIVRGGCTVSSLSAFSTDTLDSCELLSPHSFLSPFNKEALTPRRFMMDCANSFLKLGVDSEDSTTAAAGNKTNKSKTLTFKDDRATESKPTKRTTKVSSATATSISRMSRVTYDEQDEEEEEVEEAEEQQQSSDDDSYSTTKKRGSVRHVGARRKRKHNLSRSGGGSSACSGQRKMASAHARSIFLDWIATHRDNPYPTNEEKADLARLSGMSVQQIVHWFSNIRKRRLTPLVNQGKKSKANVDIKFLDELQKRQKLTR